MSVTFKSALLGLAAVSLSASFAVAQEHERGGGGAPHGAPAMHAPEPHPGPHAYQRVTEPAGWNARPATADRGAYQHNFQAARTYHIGAYRGPSGWQNHHWGYGQILPRGFWASQYFITDYWLFALETPPAGYEWVRYGNDALLVDTTTGEILQTEYGVFA
jgi:Ni/Co efflux regulator RcnB